MPDFRERKPVLLILGVHRESEGYPNVRYRLNALRTSGRFEVREINVPMWRDDSGMAAILRLPRVAFRTLVAHVSLFVRLRRAETPDVIYIPYPCVFVLNMLPRRIRHSRIVADAFVSVFDTVVSDRKLLNPSHVVARFLQCIERRAYDRADLIVVDTNENASYLQATFGLAPHHVVAVPLSTNERDYTYSEYIPVNSTIRVLFIGTFVPLHGLATIVDAARELRDRNDIEFRLIGDGQDASKIERLVRESRARITWLRKWCTPDEIAAEIRQADICLGIFGKSEKAQRVCPLKIYAYASVGRPVITADTEFLRNMVHEGQEGPFAMVPPGDPSALAQKIAELAEEPRLRGRLARASRCFYDQSLSNTMADEQFMNRLDPDLRA